MKRLNIFALMLALLVSATCLWSCSTEDDGADADTSLNDSDSDSDNDDDDGDNDNDSSVTIVGEWVYTYPDGYETDTIIFKSDGSFEVTYDYGEESTVCNGKYAITGEILTLTYTGAVWYKNDQETDRADIEEGDMVEYYCYEVSEDELSMGMVGEYEDGEGVGYDDIKDKTMADVDAEEIDVYTKAE